MRQEERGNGRRWRGHPLDYGGRGWGGIINLHNPVNMFEFVVSYLRVKFVVVTLCIHFVVEIDFVLMLRQLRCLENVYCALQPKQQT